MGTMTVTNHRAFEPTVPSALSALIDLVSGHPKTTLGLNDLLDEFTGLRKAVILMVTVYYSERKQMKLRQVKRHMGQNVEETRCKFPDVLSWWSLMDASPSQQQCVTTWVECCQVGKFTQVSIQSISLQVNI